MASESLLGLQLSLLCTLIWNVQEITGRALLIPLL